MDDVKQPEQDLKPSLLDEHFVILLGGCAAVLIFVVIYLVFYRQTLNQHVPSPSPSPDFYRATSPAPNNNGLNRFNANKIQYAPAFVLPQGIEKAQLHEPQKIEDTYFIIFLKSSFNIPISSNVQRSGVLYAKDGDKNWEIFYEITDLMKGSSYKNNPYNFWKEGNTYFTVVVDNSGAGSGEGIGKLIRINAESKQWEILDCFYYSPESYIQYISSLPKNMPLSEAIKAYIGADFQRNEGDYIFDKTLSKFVINKRVEEHCTAVKLVL